ncbi:FAD-dependent thymidylate synthase [Clostridium fermenticellae]|uniref:Flavin-dependent thymidylate synthase n=1 Tax=Clostridium fermenticellae TaxID=2068654 RepID=A0A386H0Q0_9CLOT|nr:FAD-dependent thymidylate synthase [Clostridium fermenticellae]AYD39234.1 FAD-dependent thymidylate synthase [Clostridium fermenticellae]
MKLKVKLIEHTPNPEKVVAEAAKLCYSPVGIDEIEQNLTDEKVEKFLNRLMSYGHESVVEHVSFTFAVEGVSRSLTHQLVRHRIASYSQQSQRYVRLNKFDYIIPPEIENDEKARETFIKTMEHITQSYVELSNILKNKYIDQGIKAKDAEKKAIEDARYVFPNACETKIIVTMNARSLFNFFKHRCCNRAQWEIRELAYNMFLEVRKVAPTLFKYCGPSCVNGSCSEGNMTCGKIEEVRAKYKEGE